MPIYWIIALSIVGVLIIASVAISIYLFRFAIISKNTTHKSVESDDFETDDEIKAYYNEQKAWFESTEYETIQMQSVDGLCLQGYYLPSATETDKLAFLMHGYDVRATSMSEFARFYHEQGFHVFMPDARGHGQSEGKYIGMGWTDRMDIMYWIDVMVHRLGKDIKIILHGVSMGAAAVMMASGESLQYQVKALIADCGYTSAKKELKNRIKRMYHLPPFPFVGLSGLICKIFAGYSFAEASAINQVAKNHLPIMFIHGEEDKFVPVSMAKELYDAAPGEKDLWIVPKAGHARSYYYDPNGYQQHIRAVCETFLSEKSTEEEPKISLVMDFQKID